MLKKLIYVFCGLFALLVVGLVVVWFTLGTVVVKGVNKVGPKITGTPVVLESAVLSPLSGEGTLKGLSVGNPEGWSAGNAMELGEVRVKMVPSSLMGEFVMVEEVFIDRPVIVYERRLTTSNIGDLLKQIEENLGGPAPTADDDPDAEPRKFAVKQFRLQGAQVTVGAVGTSATIPLPPLTITDLGVAEGGITADQIVAAVMRALLNQLGQAAIGAATDLGGIGGDGAKDAAKKVGEGVRKIFGGE